MSGRARRSLVCGFPLYRLRNVIGFICAIYFDIVFLQFFFSFGASGRLLAVPVACPEYFY